MAVRDEHNMRRFLDRRDFFTLISQSGSGCKTAGYQNNRLRRIAAYLDEGNIAHCPVHELKELFAALAEECQVVNHSYKIRDDPRRDESITRTPRKRARNSHGNGAHSILRFVERIIDQRYSKRPKSKLGDDEFLEDELKGYFGTKDVIFQAEEEILCLAFEMALNFLMQNEASEAGHENSTCIDNNVRDNPNSGAGSADASGRSIGIILYDGVIRTALRIIDCVIMFDKCERATRNRLQQARTNKQLPSKDFFYDRRKKYEHLLQPNRKHGSGGIRGSQSDTSSSELKSIMEEKYSKQWGWLQQFRKRHELSNLEMTNELQHSHYAKQLPEKVDEGPAMDENVSNSVTPPAAQKEKEPGSNFVIVRRRIETLDDISLPSSESDTEMNDESDAPDAEKQDHSPTGEANRSDQSPVNAPSSLPESGLASSASAAPASPLTKILSPHDKLDQETYELRMALLDMPPSESSSAEVVRHTVDEIANLLSRYGELDGAGGISRCGDVFGGGCVIAINNAKPEPSAAGNWFPLNDAMVSLLVKAFLTDATGSLRAKAFLRSFVLPLMIEMNPSAKAVFMGSNVEDHKVSKNQGKPASRSLTALLTTLARDRPIECVVSVVVPSLVFGKCVPSAPAAAEASFEPTRFQCELISRVLRGRDALSIPAITLLVEEVLPTTKETATRDRGGMKWTDNTMPVLSACLNRQSILPDAVVAKLADELSFHLSPTSPQSMAKSTKFSTLFHALVTKYGPQVKSTGKVESLKDSATQLKTFMSKTIGLTLKKLS